MKFSIFNFSISPALRREAEVHFSIFGRRGQSLVEAVVAISILVVGFLGIIALLNNSLGLNRVVAENYTATYIAAEGIEVTKNLIDANTIAGCPWNAGFTAGSFEVSYNTQSRVPSCSFSLPPYNANDFLYFHSNTGIYDYGVSGVKTPFAREIKISVSADGEEIGVNSIVRWTTRGGGNFEVNLEDHFMNWRG